LPAVLGIIGKRVPVGRERRIRMLGVQALGMREEADLGAGQSWPGSDGH
jgi:hypothetical protein